MYNPPEIFYPLLEEAERYEKLLVTKINSAGFQAYRPNQINLKKREKEDPLIYKKQQRDILIKVDNVKRLVVECKARHGNPFKYKTIITNNKEGFDLKEFPVHYIVVIDVDIKKHLLQVDRSKQGRVGW